MVVFIFNFLLKLLLLFNLLLSLILLGGGGEGELKKDGKKKFITKEQEPEQ